MTWQTKDLMELKREFLQLALHEGANRRELCRRFYISPKAAYALLKRHSAEGVSCCQPRSTRPTSSPTRTAANVEAAIVAFRQLHPGWGGCKIARCLNKAGCEQLLHPSTVTSILHRHGLISAQSSEAATPWQRFEHDTPNALWQIDFKGFVETLAGRCHPLTLLDDHSRFNLTLSAFARPDTASVKAHLQTVFERYGLPLRINGANGAPWGSPSGERESLSELSIWLIRLGISVSHSAPYHPQTNGKLERFHRSLKAEILTGSSYANLGAAELAFQRWRDIYNCERPYEALSLATPVERYCISAKRFQSVLAPIEYGPNDTVITVGWNGKFKFQGKAHQVSSALHKLPIAIRSDTKHDGHYEIYFCHPRLMHLDMTTISAER
jgi:transposase InsO family protein